MPVSILTKGKSKSTSTAKNVYVATREILIKYFDIVAISEFGKGTFGKTGTATVTLFLRRKEDEPAPSEHYFNRVNSWFSQNKKQEIFDDENLLKQYCDYHEFELSEYKTLLNSKPSNKLLEQDLFVSYKTEFDRSTDIKNFKNTRKFKELNKLEKETELNMKFVAYIVKNEKERLYFFVLAATNPCKVAIVKSPAKTTEMKKFLGYDWSSAKGNEGIKYLGEVDIEDFINSADEDADEGNVSVEEDEKRVLSNLFNLQNIKTPLYDPESPLNASKINYLINRNFLGSECSIPEELTDYVSYAHLYEMIDFKKVNFNKSISLTPKTTYNYQTKWPTEKLSKIVTTNPSKSEIKKLSDDDQITFLDMPSISELGFIERFDLKQYSEVKKGSYTYFKRGDILLAKITPCMENGKAALTDMIKTNVGFGSTEFHVLRPTDRIDTNYLFAILNNAGVRNVAAQNMTGSSGHRRVPIEFYDELKIPVPPKKDQIKLGNEYVNLDKELRNSINNIESMNNKLEKLFLDASLKATSVFKLGDESCFELAIGKRVVKKELNIQNKGLPVFSANVMEPIGFINKELVSSFDKDTVAWGIDGDWMVNHFASGFKFYPTDHCGYLRIKTDELLPKYVQWALLKEGEIQRFSRANRASLDSIRTLEIKAPALDIQEEVSEQAILIEKSINEESKKIKNIELKRTKLIEKYL
ncbi:hypothetical protein RC083_19100 [Pseudoalteromonas haloplanktis]|uniref:Uncharacterized protein n=1 Tax=Pseudoalteromonas haloplanktis TaxID=228 RepID=A0ABU1BHD0_PSEHA|nr:hypothetical protein [Pseudoalteromonas haloplanktis]MDQ9093682.1 hypothetical protein [Pseudoalteromonas haloplanktis]